MTTYFGFAIADSMFPESCILVKSTINPESVAHYLVGAVPCLNPSHQATIKAMQDRFQVHVEIPEKPPLVSLVEGDSLLVMSVRGLPRLTDRHEYSEAEIAEAEFKFSFYEVR